VAASPPFEGTQIDHLQLNSQVYLTPGFQVLGGYQKLGTLLDMISSPGSHFAVLEHVKCNAGGSTPRYTQLEVSLLSIHLSCLAIGLDIELIQGLIDGSL